MAERCCSKCKLIKNEDEFYVKNKKTGKRMAHCKACHFLKTSSYYQKRKEENPEAIREASRFYRKRGREKDRVRCKKWREQNPEKAKESQKNWRERNKEHLRELYRDYDAKRSDKKKAYRKARVEHLREIGRLWREKNAERLKERYLEYYEENKDQFKVNYHKRKARIRGNGGVFTKEQWQKLKKDCGYRCLACGKSEPEIQLTPDHVIPIAQGGRNDIDNIQPLCLKCNLSKGNKHIDYRPK